MDSQPHFNLSRVERDSLPVNLSQFARLATAAGSQVFSPPKVGCGNTPAVIRSLAHSASCLTRPQLRRGDADQTKILSPCPSQISSKGKQVLPGYEFFAERTAVGEQRKQLGKEKSNMKISRALTVLIAAVSFSMGIGLLAAPCFAQDATASSPVSFPNTKHVLGLDGVKHDASGVLTVENGSLEFTKGKQKVVVPASSIKEVLTDKDTERTLGGTAGTLTLLVPY